jgi:hypothetical protein
MRKGNLIHLAVPALLLAAGPPTVAWAAPTISGVNGTVQDGQTVTISGSGFGSGPNVVLYDSFEKGAVGANISTSVNSADVGNWSARGNTMQTYSSDYTVSGSKAMKVDWSNMYGSGPYLRYANVQNSDILISWWQFMPTNKNVPGTNGPEAGQPNWKWFWLGDENDNWPWGSDYVTVWLSNSDYGGIMGLIPADDTASPSRAGGGWYDTSFRKGTWMRYTVALKNAASGAYYWNQEVSSSGNFVKFNKTNLTTAHSGDPWNVLSLPGFGRQDNTAAAYYDDVYVAIGAGARARVEMGNASSYGSSTKLAFITPTSWSSGQINATVRQSVFKSGEKVSLFVVDATGNASPGFGPLTLGQSSTGGSTPAPAAVAPAGLKISPK